MLAAIGKMAHAHYSAVAGHAHYSAVAGHAVWDYRQVRNRKYFRFAWRCFALKH